MKTSWLVGIVLAVHCVAVGFVLLMQGCGTTRPQPVTSIPEPFPKQVQTQEKPAAFALPVPKTAEVKPAQAQTTTYTVVKGDTLSAIAQRSKLSVAEIMALNGISNPNSLKEGQKILLPSGGSTAATPARRPVSVASPKSESVKPPKSEPVKPAKVESARPLPVAAIPAGEGDVYVVKAGDALSKIAKAHGTTVEAIRNANGMKSDVIRINQKLTLPRTGARAAAPQTDTAEVGPAVLTPEKKDLVKAPVAPVAPKSPGTSAANVADAEPKVVVPPLPTPEPSGSVKIHTVAADEDLYSVAMTWGVSIAEIKKLNGLTDDAVVPGQKLKIPLNE